MKIRTLIILLFVNCQLFSQVKSEEICIENDSVKLPGTLTYTNTNAPLIIWVHGSGNVDRNGNQAGLNVRANYIKQFRDSINKKGIAFFSYDKRTSNAENFPYLKDIVLEDFVEDAKKVIAHFRKDKRFSQLVLLGHSQGSLVAMLVADDVDKFISLAGPARSIDEVVIEQTRKKSPFALDTVEAYFTELKTTGTLKYVNPMLISLFKRDNLPFLISWMRYKPIEEIKKITIPILLINGTKDIQVPAADAEALHKANSKSELLMIKDMNHVLKIIEKNEDNLKSYYRPDYPLSSELIEHIDKYISQSE